MLGYPIMGYGKLTTFVDCKNAIIDCGNDDPDLGGSHRGMGVEIGAGLSRGRTGSDFIGGLTSTIIIIC
jgi:hypothetical protein